MPEVEGDEEAELYALRLKVTVLENARMQAIKTNVIYDAQIEQMKRTAVTMKLRLHKATELGELVTDRLHLFIRALDIENGEFDATELNMAWPDWMTGVRLSQAAKKMHDSLPTLTGPMPGTEAT